MGFVSHGIKKVISPIAKFAAPFAPALGFIPGIGIPLAAGLAAGTNILAGNGIKGALSGALGAGGAAGGASLLGNSLNGAGALGLGSAGSTALGGGVLGAGAGALTNGFKGGLIGGVLGGVGGYVQGSGGISNALSNIKGDITSGYNSLTGAGTEAAGSASDAIKSNVYAGGGSGSYNLNPVNKDTINSTAFLGGSNADLSPITGGISTSPLSTFSQGDSSMGSNYISPLLSAGIGTYTNNKAQSDLLKGQKNAFNTLSPFLNSSFDPGDLTQDPGYQFQLAQGTKALDRAQSSHGNYFSGEALQDAQDYGQGLAGQTYNDAYNRYLQNQQQKIGVASTLGGIQSNIGNVNASAITNEGNLLSGSGAALLGGQGISNSGMMQGALGGSNLTPQQLVYLRQLGVSV